MKRAALYVRVSTVDQHPENQMHELRQFSSQRGLQIVQEYVDHGFCGARARRPALDKMLEDAHRHRFDVVVVWSCDRLARSTKHLLHFLDEISGLGIQFLSQREEAIDTEGPLGRAILVIVSAIAELERSILIERIKAGMKRVQLVEGRRLGRAPLQVNRALLLRDRERGLSLNQLAKAHGISKASVCRVLKAERESVSRGFQQTDHAFSEPKEVATPIPMA